MSPVVETRICRVSGKSFDITDDDMKFYEKISPVFDGEKMLIPPPTLCPLERKRRRLSYRGGYRLYRTTCALSAKPIISVYAPNRGYQATDQVIWWSDQVENLDRGREYDFSQTFTEQFGTLLRETPLPCLSNEYKSNINSDYVQGTNYLKDCYLVFNAQNSQDSAYSEALYDSSDMYDSYFVRECSDSYECIGNLRCQSCISLEESEDCSRVDFSYHCKGCSDSILCHEMENKKYCIANREYTKEEYEKERLKLLGKNGGYDMAKMIELFQKMKQENDIEKVIIYSSEDVTGNHITNCKNIVEGYDIIGSENCKYIATFGMAKDCYDCFSFGYTAEKVYESMAVGAGACDIIGCFHVWSHTARVYYSYTCFNCSDCLGCVGLKGKQYCIFNKQYTKEAYEKLARKIIKKMQEDGEWGEGLSQRISQYGYNESAANLYFPLSREEAISRGFQWNEYESPFPEVEQIIPASRLPENIGDVPDDILNWAIECEVTKKPFRIIQQELEFYRKHRLPIPKKHPDIRRRERFERRV